MQVLINGKLEYASYNLMSSIESRVADLVRNVRQVSPTDIAIALCSVIIRVLTVSCRVKSRAYRPALGEIPCYLNTVYLQFDYQVHHCAL